MNTAWTALASDAKRKFGELMQELRKKDVELSIIQIESDGG